MQRATERSREGAPTAHRSNARRLLPPFPGLIAELSSRQRAFSVFYRTSAIPPQTSASISTHPAEIATSQLIENKQKRPSCPDTRKQDKPNENPLEKRPAHTPPTSAPASHIQPQTSALPYWEEEFHLSSRATAGDDPIRIGVPSRAARRGSSLRALEGSAFLLFPCAVIPSERVRDPARVPKRSRGISLRFSCMSQLGTPTLTGSRRENSRLTHCKQSESVSLSRHTKTTPVFRPFAFPRSKTRREIPPRFAPGRPKRKARRRYCVPARFFA
jgi:hypothetical protein